MEQLDMNPPVVSRPEQTEKFLEELEAQMLLMQQTIKTMENTLVEIKNVQNQIVIAIAKMKEASVSEVARAIISSVDSEKPTDKAINGNSSSGHFEFVEVGSVEIATETRHSIFFGHPRAQKIEYPTVGIFRILEQYPHLSAETALHLIKELPDWKEEFENSANLGCLMNAAKRQTEYIHKNLFVSFLSEQTVGMDQSKPSNSGVWQYRIEIIMDALCQRYVSIKLDDYEKPIKEYVNLWKNGKQTNFEPILIIFNRLFGFFSTECKQIENGYEPHDLTTHISSLHVIKNSNDDAFSDVMETLVSISEGLGPKHRNKIAFMEFGFMEILLKLMNKIMFIDFLIPAWKFLWNITEEFMGHYEFSSCDGLGIAERHYYFHKNNGNFELLVNLFGTIANFVKSCWMDRRIWKSSYTNMVKNAIETQNRKIIQAVAAKVLVILLSKETNGILGLIERHDCLHLLHKYIPTWKYNIPLTATHSTLNQLVRLFTKDSACQLYAAWYICNLLTVNNVKYIAMLKENHFEKELKNVLHIKHLDPYTVVMILDILNTLEVAE